VAHGLPVLQEIVIVGRERMARFTDGVEEAAVAAG